jgi:phosphonoacetaldehyde hydrolase
MNYPHSNYTYRRTYQGKVKALVLDWSGTLADAFVIAPAVVFVEVFKNQGVEISMAEARGPMGLRKDLHIQKLTEDPVIATRWEEIKGKAPNQNDVDAMFAEFVPLQLNCLRQYTTLLPGIADVCKQFQKSGIKIGASTGFVRSMVDILLEDCIKQGFEPDATVAGDEVINGARPAPHMVYKNLDLMNISPIQSVVKVDDTASGVGEALEAGCWGVGVSKYSNYLDISTMEEFESMSAAEFERRHEITRETLSKTGAHYVIDSLVDLPPVIDDINARMARGERP